MGEVNLSVGGMKCGHCVKAVEQAVGALPGVTGCLVDLEAARVTVAVSDAAPADLRDRFKAAIEEEGYTVADG
ncbi:MAG: heavy-metal-associated domain-containing protein [Magnetococcales bacterium]|nr:heavy-metal-associated domain-containing protein [Magnetococcales bacterium]